MRHVGAGAYAHGAGNEQQQKLRLHPVVKRVVMEFGTKREWRLESRPRFDSKLNPTRTQATEDQGQQKKHQQGFKATDLDRARNFLLHQCGGARELCFQGSWRSGETRINKELRYPQSEG